MKQKPLKHRFLLSEQKDVQVRLSEVASFVSNDQKSVRNSIGRKDGG